MLDIQNIVYSRIKNKTYTGLKTKFPNINFTTSDRGQVLTKFPTVYVHESASAERGQDLEGDTINAVMSVIQIEVYDNESMANTKYVMDDIVAVMKSMRYSVSQMPEYQNDNNVYRRVARFSRLIGSGDTL